MQSKLEDMQKEAVKAEKPKRSKKPLVLSK